MRNEMHFVSVARIDRVAHNAVVFTISLESHAHLRDPEVVQRSMDAYMVQFPNVEKWEARAENGWLYIHVTGQIRQHIDINL
jgi:hypothetical protein